MWRRRTTVNPARRFRRLQKRGESVVAPCPHCKPCFSYKNIPFPPRTLILSGKGARLCRNDQPQPRNKSGSLRFIATLFRSYFPRFLSSLLKNWSHPDKSEQSRIYGPDLCEPSWMFVKLRELSHNNPQFFPQKSAQPLAAYGPLEPVSPEFCSCKREFAANTRFS